MYSNHPYTDKEKLELIKRSLPPENISIVALAKELKIPQNTLYAWKKKFKQTSEISSYSNNKSSWSAQEKFHVVIETYHLNEAELAAYCRSKGLYVDQVKSWSNQCLLATNNTTPDPITLVGKLKEQTTRANRLEKELSRKEKALAETAALLVLGKKAQAIWGEAEEDL